MRAAALALATGWLAASGIALALEEAQWPPPAGVAQRMRELQQAIISRGSSAAERDAARRELGDLLKSPAGQARPTPDEKPRRPARAAIDPFPSVVRPAERVPAAPVSPGVAHIEVLEPPRPLVIGPAGVPAPTLGNFAVDPRTGNVLHGVPGGFIDPRTGQIFAR